MGGKLVSGNKISSKHANRIITEVKKVIGDKGLYITGSLRRGKSEIGDIDLVVVREEAAINLNERLKLLTGKDLSKRKTCSFVFNNVQIDLNICSSDIKVLIFFIGLVQQKKMLS